MEAERAERRLGGGWAGCRKPHQRERQAWQQAPAQVPCRLMAASV